MSGPISAVTLADPLAVLLAAAAIEAARSIQAGAQAADALAAQGEHDRLQRQQRQSAAALQGQAALAAATEAARSQLQQWLAQAQTLGCQEPVRALVAATEARLEALAHDAEADRLRLQVLEQLCERVHGVLVAAQAQAGERAPELPETLEIPDAQETPRTAPSLARRLLARLQGTPVPAALQALGDELDTLTHGATVLEPARWPERAYLLADELRLGVQREQDRRLKDAQARATALVLEQTLQDLGYQVEEVGHTLFVQGGVVHFRRAGWGDYLVRLRVQADGQGVNFNVVRAVQAASNERSVLDHLAEDRWCAEFPALQRALEARGLRLQVTRRLQAGELPVQQVQRSQLPHFAEDDAQTGVAASAPLRLQEPPV